MFCLCSVGVYSTSADVVEEKVIRSRYRHLISSDSSSVIVTVGMHDYMPWFASYSVVVSICCNLGGVVQECCCIVEG